MALNNLRIFCDRILRSFGETTDDLPIQIGQPTPGAFAILGVPTVTSAAQVDRTVIVAQEGKAAPPYHRKRILRRIPYDQNQSGPSHSSEHSDAGDRSGTSGSSDRAGGGGGASAGGGGGGRAGGGGGGEGGGGGGSR